MRKKKSKRWAMTDLGKAVCDAGSSWNVWALMKAGLMGHNVRKATIPKGSVCASFPGKREASTKDQTADLQES